MSGRNRRCTARLFFLAFVLLAAQLLAAAHYDLDDSHPDGARCAVCTVLGTLGTGNVAATAAWTAPEPVAFLVARRHRATASCVEHTFRARGPPLTPRFVV